MVATMITIAIKEANIARKTDTNTTNDTKSTIEKVVVATDPHPPLDHDRETGENLTNDLTKGETEVEVDHAIIVVTVKEVGA